VQGCRTARWREVMEGQWPKQQREGRQTLGGNAEWRKGVEYMKVFK
jgi:hypothetical protein